VLQNGWPALMVTNWLPSALVKCWHEVGLGLAELVPPHRRGQQSVVPPGYLQHTVAGLVNRFLRRPPWRRPTTVDR
jgi:hypothetical protein